MSTSQELARFHIETAIKLVGREGVVALLSATPATVVTAATGGAGAGAGASNRGRRPGAASEDTRCQWKLTDGTLCKNARHGDTLTYCRIHAGKIDLIDL